MPKLPKSENLKPEFPMYIVNKIGVAPLAFQFGVFGNFGISDNFRE
jgi:hypothetical protein